MALLFSTAAAETTLHFTFTGDCTLGSEEAKRKQATSFDSVNTEKGYDWPFANMQELFQNDDLTVVNLEGVLSDSNRNENKDKTYRFRGPTAFVDILTRSGIVAVNLANNHTQDFGKQGYTATQETLAAAGVGYFGSRSVYIFEKDGIKVAFFGLNSTAFNGNKAWAKEEIARLKQEEGVNAVVFTFHAGQEYGKHRNQAQETYAHYMIDAGADLIIGHHPHVVQGMEIYNNRTICYSLGNFAFGGNKEVRALETVEVDVALTFDDAGNYLGQQLTLYPANISGTYPENNYQPVLVSGDAAQDVMALIQNDTDYELAPYTDEAGCAQQPYLPAQPERLLRQRCGRGLHRGGGVCLTPATAPTAAGIARSGTWTRWPRSSPRFSPAGIPSPPGCSPTGEQARPQGQHPQPVPRFPPPHGRPGRPSRHHHQVGASGER